MTRFVKVSLSVVALLLVTLMMFTGCANKALTAAEEAAQAVEDAVKELEEAIDEKADADELAAKVEALNAAVEAANALVTDGDTALKAALEEAKKTVFANAEALISTYNTQITALLNAKANVADINAKFAQLKVLEQNLNNITGGAVKIEDYTALTTTAAYYAYKLEMLWNTIQGYEELYAVEDYAALVEAYKYCEVAIYRATSESVLKQAFDNFEAAMKDAKNAVDVLYYDDILPYVNGNNKSTEAAYNLYNKVKTTYDALTEAKAQNLVRNYYSGYLAVNPGNDYTTEDLLVKTIELWRAELKADVDELGTRYLVYVANGTYNDKAEMDAARNYINLFNGTTAGEGQTLTTGEADKVGVAAFTVPGLFTANEARMNALTGKAFLASGANGAAAAADYVNAQALLFFFGANEDEATLADVDDALIAEKAVANRESVNAVNYLKKIVDQWASDFAPAMGSNPSTANQARYAANKAAIDDVTALVNKTYSYLYDGAIAEYKAEAAEFIDVAKKFFTNGQFDENLVHFSDGPAIEAAIVKANAWATKWTYTDLDVYDATVDVTAVKAYGAILIAKEYYPVASQAAINAWKALASNIELYATWTEDTLVDMYDNTLETTIAWYTTYGFVTNGVVDESVNTLIFVDYEGQLPTPEYYAELNRLVGVRDAAYAAQTAARNALQAKIDTIDTLTLAQYGNDCPTAINELKAEIAEYKAITANCFAYDTAANAHKLNEADVTAAETRYADLVADAEELADVADIVMALTSANGRDNIISAKNTLGRKITAFADFNGEDDANYTRVAYAAIKFAEKLVEDIDIKGAAADLNAKVAALENAVTALENANDDITVAPYFANDNAKNAHVALMDAIATAKANLATSANAYKAAVEEYCVAYAAYQAYDANLLDVDVDALPGAVDYNTNKAAAEADADAAVAVAEVFVAKYDIVVTKINPIKVAALADTHGDAELAEVVESQYVEALAKVDALANVNDTVTINNIVSVYEQAISAAWALAGFASPINA